MGHSVNACKRCGKHISRYTIDRVVRENGMDAFRTYFVKLCWGCSYFSIYPNIKDEFTTAVLRNKLMLIELIEDKKLKPII